MTKRDWYIVSLLVVLLLCAIVSAYAAELPDTMQAYIPFREIEVKQDTVLEDLNGNWEYVGIYGVKYSNLWRNISENTYGYLINDGSAYLTGPSYTGSPYVGRVLETDEPGVFQLKEMGSFSFFPSEKRMMLVDPNVLFVVNNAFEQEMDESYFIYRRELDEETLTALQNTISENHANREIGLWDFLYEAPAKEAVDTAEEPSN